MSTLNTDIKSFKVVDTTEWIALERYKNLEQGPGVFLLSNFFYQVKFIGKTQDGEMVKAIDEALKKAKSAGVAKVKVIYTKSESHANQLQKRLIAKYNTIQNLK